MDLVFDSLTIPVSIITAAVAVVLATVRGISMRLERNGPRQTIAAIKHARDVLSTETVSWRRERLMHQIDIEYQRLTVPLPPVERRLRRISNVAITTWFTSFAVLVVNHLTGVPGDAVLPIAFAAIWISMILTSISLVPLTILMARRRQADNFALEEPDGRRATGAAPMSQSNPSPEPAQPTSGTTSTEGSPSPVPDPRSSRDEHQPDLPPARGRRAHDPGRLEPRR